MLKPSNLVTKARPDISDAQLAANVAFVRKIEGINADIAEWVRIKISHEGWTISRCKEVLLALGDTARGSN